MKKCILEEAVAQLKGLPKDSAFKDIGNPIDVIKQIDPTLMEQCAASGCKKCKPYINLLKGLVR